MNTIKLAELLMQKLRWNYQDLASKVGVSRQGLHRAIKNPIKTERRDGFHLGVICVAFKHGFEAEALSIILGRNGNQKVSSVLRAAIMYPDLKPNELEQILRVEEMTNMSPLPIEVIKSIIEKSRS